MQVSTKITTCVCNAYLSVKLFTPLLDLVVLMTAQIVRKLGPTLASRPQPQPPQVGVGFQTRRQTNQRASPLAAPADVNVGDVGGESQRCQVGSKHAGPGQQCAATPPSGFKLPPLLFQQERAIVVGMVLSVCLPAAESTAGLLRIGPTESVFVSSMSPVGSIACILSVCGIETISQVLKVCLVETISSTGVWGACFVEMLIIMSNSWRETVTWAWMVRTSTTNLTFFTTYAPLGIFNFSITVSTTLSPRLVGVATPGDTLSLVLVTLGCKGWRW